MSYTSQKPFSGNISFNNPPLNCPFPAPTLYEFTLNNYGIITKAQETIDISCVYGVTTIGQFTLSNGGVWNSGQNDTIKTIQNNLLYYYYDPLIIYNQMIYQMTYHLINHLI